jgi:hypothetical protein
MTNTRGEGSHTDVTLWFVLAANQGGRGYVKNLPTCTVPNLAMGSVSCCFVAGVRLPSDIR